MQYYSQGSLSGKGGADSFHLAQFFFVQELKTSALHSLVCAGKHQICTNGKKEKKTSLTAPPSHLRFDQEQTAALLQSLTNTMAQYVEKKSHRHKHVKTMNEKSNTREYSAFLISYEHSVGFLHWRMC